MFKALAALTVASILVASAAAEDNPGYLGVQIKLHEVGGKVLIHVVQADSPAEKAGLKAGDVIVKIADKEPGNLKEFVDEVRTRKPGDKVKITYKRDEETKTVEIKLEKPPENFGKP